MLRQVTCQPIRSVHTSRRRRVSPFKEDIANEGGVRGLRRLSDYKPLGIVQKLGKTLGVKDHVDDHWLVSLLALNKVKECITEIAKYLGLPIQIDLSYVPRGYRPGSTDNFSTTDLVKTAQGGSGSQGCAVCGAMRRNVLGQWRRDAQLPEGWRHQ